MKKVGTGNKIMTTVKCTICGMDMDCPESMLGADRHFCAGCTGPAGSGLRPGVLKMSPEGISQHFFRCDEIAKEMMDLTLDSYWEKVQEYGKKHFNHELLAKDCYLQGASSMLGLLISQGMPEDFLDDLEEVVREAKRERVGR